MRNGTFFGEYESAAWIAVSAGITAIAGYLTLRVVSRPETITVKEGFATVGLAFIDANLAEGLDLVTATSAVAASLGNSGPGLGEVGPMANYADLPQLAKWMLASLMIVGHLEIFPVLVLFTRICGAAERAAS